MDVSTIIAVLFSFLLAAGAARAEQHHPRLWPTLRNIMILFVALEVLDTYGDIEAGRWFHAAFGVLLAALFGKWATDLHLKIQRRRQIIALDEQLTK